ncbi:MAG: apolipoprotein N-acyltransferase [Coxiella sp. RIFCSPHIGHO2_12_FULL_42_15]|nr:MAG: apolipoprotein N-acyltransferase [Coxiella sp. RIFCSPHIGHO2_12_FULL_42_15]
MKSKNFLFALLSFIAGGIFVLAFAPFHWYVIGFAAPALLLYCWKNATPAQAFWRGFFFGLGEFIMGTSWIYISIHKFGNATVLLAGFITTLFILFMSSYPALQGYIFSQCFRHNTLWQRCLFAFPSTWVIFEILRAYLFTGFPWLLLGYSQTRTIFNGFAPLLSVFGISLIVSMMSGALILFIDTKATTQRMIAATLILIFITVSVPLHDAHWTHPTKRALSVALVQGNVPQSLKWDANEAFNTIQKYLRATQPYWNKQLILWPEAAVPILSTEATAFIQELHHKAKQHHSALIFGIPGTNDQQNKFYNSIMTVGQGHGTYFKRHPVPFGEYIPLPSIFGAAMRYFDIPMSNLSKGPKKQPLLQAQGIKIAPFVCYEITYPNEVIPYSKGSQLLVTVNDDSWFGDSFAQPQQIQMAKMRAIETGRPILYVSNTGITAIIGTHGKIVRQIPENRLLVLTGEVHPTMGNTPLMIYKFYPLYSIVVLLFIAGLYNYRKKP